MEGTLIKNELVEDGYRDCLWGPWWMCVSMYFTLMQCVIPISKEERNKKYQAPVNNESDDYHIIKNDKEDAF